jgi:hypothetical protein
MDQDMADGRLMRAADALAITLLVAPAGARPASAQSGGDSIANGTLIGAATGAGIGVALTYATRDSDLTAGQYAHGTLIFGAIGAGVGLGVDAMLDRSSRGSALRPPRRVLIAPAIWKRMTGVVVKCRW